jgi:hypothetical protein
MLSARLAVKGRLGRLELMEVVVPFQYCCVQIVLYVWDSRFSVPEQRELNGYTVFYSKCQEKLRHSNKFNPVYSGG